MSRNRPCVLNRVGTFLCLALGLLNGVPAFAQWSEVTSGIFYREFQLAGPVRVYVARADRNVETWTIDSMTSLGEIKGGRETVPDMAARYDGSITSDGRRYEVKVAINGDYYDMKTGVALGGQIISGWFARRFGDSGGNSGFVWTTDRRCFLGGNVQDGPAHQHVIFSDGTSLKINQLNEPRGKDALALFTPQFASNTATSDDGLEVLVRVNVPVGLGNKAPGITGEVIKVREHTGASPLLFNHVILSAHGKAADELRKHVQVGQVLQLKLELKDQGKPDIGLPPGDWRDAYASIGGPKCILVNGKVPRDWEVKAAKYASEGKKHGSVVKDPRTAVAFNDHYIFFLVIDGRSKASLGMTFTEAGLFCKDELKASNAILQDGGGSSTLWVNGKVRNVPSGKGTDEKFGVLRPAANGYLIAQLLPPKRSTAFVDGQKVQIKNSGELRLGPGTTFGSARKVSEADHGVILPEPLNGIFAKGAYWWFCRVGEAEGWASLEQLIASR